MSSKKDSKSAALVSSLSGLEISTSSNKSSKKPAVADSWDDDSDSTASSPSPASPSKAGSQAPPPTPAILSPHAPSSEFSSSSSTRFSHIDEAFDSPMAPAHDADERYGSSSRRTTGTDPDRRPDKTTSVASRLIAAGIGAKAPKRTEEQRAYEKSAREMERKRKEREIQERKRAEEEKERARKSVWDD